MNTTIGCRCGHTSLEVQGKPFMVSECLCDSCRAAGVRLARLPGAKSMLTSYEATPCAEYRKDRVRFVAGKDNLKEFRLSSDAGTRRVVATCCNTPVFQEMKGAHWISLYTHLWPENSRPKPERRTMVGDLADASHLPDDIPNLKTHTVIFYLKLLGAWAAMGFKNPKIEIRETIDA